MESALIAESGYLKDAFADLKHSLMREQESLSETISIQVEERLSKLRDELEDTLEDRLKTMLAEEADRRDKSRTIHETYKNDISAVVGTVNSAESQARQHLSLIHI
eukprot:2913678-Pyramimonas_sp.AAC.1